MRLLIFGRTGQVARELARLAPEATCLDRQAADLNDPDGCARAIRAARPDAVINAAAWTAVDLAESHADSAHRINAAAPGAMARACAGLGIPFLHVSSDYVFDGRGTRPWHPDDPPAPVSAYGRSKRAGEEAVRAAGGRYLILRTSWVFSAHGDNFVRTMLRLSRDHARLRVVADQTGGPTPADALAAALLTAAAALRDGASGGVHHFAGAPDTSWAGFARAVFAVAGLDTRVTEIATTDWPTPATRPLNSRLDCTGFGTAFGLPRPDWQDALRRIVPLLRDRSP